MFKNAASRFKWVIHIQKRYRVKQKWAHTRKSKTYSELALEYMDTYYPPVYGKKWHSIRLALLSQQKYCAVLNNFSDDCKEIEIDFFSQGANNILKIAQGAQPEYFGTKRVWHGSLNYREEGRREPEPWETEHVNDPLPDMGNTYMTSIDNQRDLDIENITVPETEDIHSFVQPKRTYTEDELLEKEEYEQNVFEPPDISVPIEPPGEIELPKHLKAHVFEKGDITLFPSPTRDGAKLLGFYPMDAASLLPVFALDLRPEDHVLDLCAAPGGKSLVMLQTLLPGQLVCNDKSYTRLSRLRHILKSYVPSSGNVQVAQEDGTRYGGTGTDIGQFDKVLVDVPCLTDRHVLNENDNNIFKPGRTKERLELPQIQKSLLLSGIRNCKPGGTVVYSTCSLSPAQNDGVIQAAFEELWHSTKIDIVVEDTRNIAEHFHNVYSFHKKCRFGQLVLPNITSNFGPMYFCKIKRLN